MEKKTIADYTEAEFLAFIRKMWVDEGTTEEEDVRMVDEFRRLSEHPEGSDVLFYPPPDREDSPEGIVKEVKEWREKNGRPGLKPG